MFSVAVATVLFPQLSRLAAREDFAGLRRCIGDGHAADRAAADPRRARRRSCSATPIARLVYQRGEFDAGVDRADREALFWFAFSLPFAAGTCCSRARSSRCRSRGCRPAGRRLARVNAVVLARALQAAGDRRHRARHGDLQRRADRAPRRSTCARELGGLEPARTLRALGADARRRGRRWARRLRRLVGARRRARALAARPDRRRSAPALALGALVYAAVVLALRIPEARQIARPVCFGACATPLVT